MNVVYYYYGVRSSALMNHMFKSWTFDLETKSSRPNLFSCSASLHQRWHPNWPFFRNWQSSGCQHFKVCGAPRLCWGGGLYRFISHPLHCPVDNIPFEEKNVLPGKAFKTEKYQPKVGVLNTKKKKNLNSDRPTDRPMFWHLQGNTTSFVF